MHILQYNPSINILNDATNAGNGGKNAIICGILLWHTVCKRFLFSMKGFVPC